MDIDTLFESAKDTMTVERVFGHPVEQNGLVVIPVAVVVGGGGGGSRESASARPAEAGGGFGAWARPIGVYVVKDGDVRFRPAVDLVPLLLCTLLAVPWLARRLCRRTADTHLTRRRRG